MVWLIFSACGYRFVGGGSFPAGIRAVFVEVFQNRTAESGIENTFTNDLIYEISRNTDTYLTGKENADGILSGTITNLTTETISVRGQNIAAERRLKVRVDLKLTDSTGKVVWSANGVPASETYPVGDTKQRTFDNAQAAILVLSKRFAEEVYTQLTSDF